MDGTHVRSVLRVQRLTKAKRRQRLEKKLQALQSELDHLERTAPRVPFLHTYRRVEDWKKSRDLKEKIRATEYHLLIFAVPS